MAKTIAFLVFLFVFPAAYAVNYTVGDNSGWNTNVDYNTWARPLNFTVGDALIFTYGPGHTVDEVSRSDYSNCNTASPISSYTSSPTTITLNTTATRYFICGATGHCGLGQSLAVNVTAGSTAPSPAGSTPPPTGSTPPTGSVPSTPDAPPSAASSPETPPSTTSPPAPSAASTLANGQIAFSLVLAAMVGLMG